MTVTTTRLPTGTVSVSMPWSACDWTIAQPKNVPTANPSVVPNTAMMIDSQRTMAKGQANAEIAAQLYVSHATVKTHVSRLLMKLDARDRAQLVMIAYVTGVASPGMA